MSQLTLPPVAKSFYAFCKKCNVDRYHIVLAHTTPTKAKIECEVCHSKKTFSLPKEEKPGVVKKPKSSTGAATRKNSHTGEYELRTQKTQNAEPISFSIKTKFKENQKINHAKFGIGFVQKVYDEKIDVMFADEVKSLVHGRV